MCVCRKDVSRVSKERGKQEMSREREERGKREGYQIVHALSIAFCSSNRKVLSGLAIIQR